MTWLINPKQLGNAEMPGYREFKADIEKEGQDKLDLAKKQYDLAESFNKDTQIDLNDILVNYVDLKYDQIWSDEYCRKKKWELKNESFYFRTVKQGSVLVYLSFHVATILIVLLMAVLR